MILGKKSLKMLKYQKAKAKLVEYNVNEENYPNFLYNSNELSYPTTYILSRYSECIIENNEKVIKKLAPLLTATAQYYDAAVNSKDRQMYDYDFLLSGASAYFLSNDFGSAKVLSSKANSANIPNLKTPQKMLLHFFNSLLLGKSFIHISENNTYSKTNNAIFDFFKNGKSIEEIDPLLKQYRKETYAEGNPENVFYIDVLYAVILKAINNSSWLLLPQYSKLSKDAWRDYLTKASSIKMLWPSQQLIGEKGVLSGENAIVQLPTGVGKTKSIELIIRAAFLSSRATTAIIVAPLRALCNEITSDMMRAFGRDTNVNQFSDILQDDIDFSIEKSLKNQIIICTPEKLSYIIHHQPDFFKLLDLFIFDEGHMFDDGSRGATYELLVTHIKQELNDLQQFVLLSAVLPNSEVIKNWLFKENGVLAADKNIITTPKSVGFASRTQDVYFYTDDPNNYDYFIPRVIRTEKLRRLPRERKDKYFPELSSSIDVALYNAIRLCKNGGVAIYMSQQRSIRTVLERLLDLNKRGIDLSVINANCSMDQIEKLSKFISNYYGNNYIYSEVGMFGVFPHSSNIPNGIKIAIEYALKHNHVHFVVCTSTLAQGVNIPIRYLFITSLRTNRALMKTRNFQNLIGRTGRSGIYTEGNIIITDLKIYDQRLDQEHGGNYRWNECIDMFDPNTTEPCGSSILLLIKSLKIDYEAAFKGEAIANYIIENYSDENCFENLANKLYSASKKLWPMKNLDNIGSEISLRKSIVETIENYLCLVFSENEQQNKHDLSKEICQNTLAYSLASDNEKSILEKVFDAITSKIELFSTDQLRIFSYAMSGIKLSSAIEKWLLENEITSKQLTETQLLDLIIDFFLQTHEIKKLSDRFKAICVLWIEGKTPLVISLAMHCAIPDIDNLCNKTLSFELNFFVGNICDMISANEDTQVNPYLTMNLLQQKIKYGVPTKTAVSICEKVFNDRLLAIQIANIINNDNIDVDNIISVIRSKREEILYILDDYPEYFSERLKFVLQ